MSIRILDHNGNVQPLSARMNADFQSELRRIGEAQLPPAVTLWVSNQTPAELLETLKRIPDFPPEDGSGLDKAQTPPSQIFAPENSNEASSTTPVLTRPYHAASTGNHLEELAANIEALALPHHANPSAELIPSFLKHRRVYNSAYQGETGYIYVDPCGFGERVNMGGRDVNLRDEEERERSRREGRVERRGEGERRGRG